MTFKEKAADKATSVTAWLMLLMGIVLCAKVGFMKIDGYEDLMLELFKNSLYMLLGYYIGRDRDQKPLPVGDKKETLP